MSNEERYEITCLPHPALNTGAVKLLDEARSNGWLVVDRKSDRKAIRPFAKK